LIEAAAAATARTRPLSLFYALSQAGRAVAAARLQGEWQLKGHGLQTTQLDAAHPSEVRVRLKPSRNALASFAGIGAAIDSELLEGLVTVGELWASLPGLCDLIPEGHRNHPPPLGVVVEDDATSPLRNWKIVTATVAPITADGPEGVQQILSAYRHGRSATLRTIQGLKPLVGWTKHGQGVQVCWPNPREDFGGQWEVLEDVAPLDSYVGDHWLRPELSDGSSPSELITWWALLYALSMLARYEPAAWFRALDYDSSPWAAPLGELLRIGVDVVPDLVLRSLHGKPEWGRGGGAVRGVGHRPAPRKEPPPKKTRR
jgi:hypothetical protein